MMNEEKVLILYPSNNGISKRLNIPTYLPVPFKNWIFFEWKVHFVVGCVEVLAFSKELFQKHT